MSSHGTPGDGKSPVERATDDTVVMKSEPMEDYSEFAKEFPESPPTRNLDVTHEEMSTQESEGTEVVDVRKALLHGRHEAAVARTQESEGTQVGGMDEKNSRDRLRGAFTAVRTGVRIKNTLEAKRSGAAESSGQGGESQDGKDEGHDLEDEGHESK